MADKSKRPPRFDLKSTEGKSGRLIQIGGTAFIVIFAVALVFYIVTSHHDKKGAATGPGDTVRVTSSKVVNQPGTNNPKAVVTFYEDFLCPACGNFERTFGPTVSKLIDSGAIAADYSVVSILDSSKNQNYPSRAGAAALCVADESMDAFRRFHTALFSTGIQPDERGPNFPDNAKLIELAREAGVVGKVPDCINSG
ncbi:DsbA family protein, partial [Mycobacterium montefiorense]